MHIGRYLRRRVRNFLWRAPQLYKPVDLVRFGNRASQPKPHILTDGFPRSGNSYMAELIRHCRPDLRVDSHRHRPPYIIAAVHRSLPVCLALRKPIDCVASCVASFGVDAVVAYEDYIDFHRTIASVLKSLTVIPFEEITGDINRLLSRVETALGSPVRPSMTMEKLEYAAKHAVAKLPWGNEKISISLPSSKRQSRIAEITDAVMSGEYNSLNEEALRHYRRFLFHADKQLEINQKSNITPQAIFDDPL